MKITSMGLRMGGEEQFIDFLLLLFPRRSRRLYVVYELRPTFSCQTTSVRHSVDGAVP